MKRRNLNRPRKVKALGGTAVDAWWYENPNSIDVIVECKARDGTTTDGIVRIPRHQLARWLRHTERKP